MITEARKGPFRTALVVLDDSEALRLAHEARYDRIVIISHQELALPNFSVRKKEGGLIPVTDSPDAILKQFNATAQKKIGRTFRYEGFSFERYTYPFPSEAYALYADFERGRGNVPFPGSTFNTCVCFLVRDGGLPVSGAFVYQTVPVMRARSFFSSRKAATDHEGYKRVSYASNRVIYECCRFAHESGAISFDIGPINSTDPSKAGISNFKSSFNPDVVPEYTYTRTKPLFRLFERILGTYRYFRSRILSSFLANIFSK